MTYRAALITSLLLPTTDLQEATAQPSPPLVQLESLLKPGDSVIVTDGGGKSTKGKVTTLTQSSLALIDHGKPREFSLADVKQIQKERKDPKQTVYRADGTASRAMRVRPFVSRQGNGLAVVLDF